MVALLVVMGLAYLLYSQREPALPTPQAHEQNEMMPTMPGLGGMNPGGSGEADESLWSMLAQRDAADFMQQQPGDEPLRRNPGRMPTYEGATMDHGIRRGTYGGGPEGAGGDPRSTRGPVEDMAFFTHAEADPNAVQAFYDAAAKEQGYTPIEVAGAEGDHGNVTSTNRIYWRSSSSHSGRYSVLVVRSWRENDATRIMLWSRSTGGHRPANPSP